MFSVKSKDVNNQKIEMQYTKQKKVWAISFDPKTHRYILWVKDKITKLTIQDSTSVDIEKLINKIPDNKLKSFH